MAEPTSARVVGHGLRWEGRAMTSPVSRSWQGDHVVFLSARSGRGQCECGARSPDLPTIAARQRWHRQHKGAVLDAMHQTTVTPQTTGANFLVTCTCGERIGVASLRRAFADEAAAKHRRAMGLAE